ncbi:hypothetical protein TNIN_473841 [Trichonephila inaurata madagascariensis]|uniref:Uncharacterized protein n=1 Tax=Trichonephila inaurata madagascariensis TaxID=2747483 RepID=A0A8X7C4H3_9ARAC|nr:hypothetical protein TNIN_473841 [Trichonephila inaurata madagascariensis]
MTLVIMQHDRSKKDFLTKCVAFPYNGSRLSVNRILNVSFTDFEKRGALQISPKLEASYSQRKFGPLSLSSYTVAKDMPMRLLVFYFSMYAMFCIVLYLMHSCDIKQAFILAQ